MTNVIFVIILLHHILLPCNFLFNKWEMRQRFPFKDGAYFCRFDIRFLDCDNIFTASGGNTVAFPPLKRPCFTAWVQCECRKHWQTLNNFVNELHTCILLLHLSSLHLNTQTNMMTTHRYTNTCAILQFSFFLFPYSPFYSKQMCFWHVVHPSLDWITCQHQLPNVYKLLTLWLSWLVSMPFKHTHARLHNNETHTHEDVCNPQQLY